MLHSLDHVILGVRDLPAATRTLCRLLGRQPSWRGEHPSAGTANVLFRLENTYLELLAPEGTGPIGDAVRARLESEGEGLLGLAFGTADAEACRAALAERGLEPGEVVDGVGRDVESGAFRTWRTVMPAPTRTRGVVLFAIEHRSPDAVLPEAPVAAPEAASAVSALDHVVVQSADADGSRAVYGDGLGIRLALDRSFEAWGVRLLFFRVGGVTVEIAASLGQEPQPDAPDRLWGLSLRAPDVEAARERVAKAGFDVSEVREGRKPGTRVCTVRGEPLGVATLLIGPASPVAPSPVA